MKHITMPRLAAPHIKLNRTALLVTVAVLFVLSVFAYGAIRKHQLDESQAQAAAAQAQAVQAQKQASDKAFKEASTELTIERNKATLACTQLAQYAAAPKTKALVVVPAFCK